MTTRLQRAPDWLVLALTALLFGGGGYYWGSTRADERGEIGEVEDASALAFVARSTPAHVAHPGPSAREPVADRASLFDARVGGDAGLAHGSAVSVDPGECFSAAFRSGAHVLTAVRTANIRARLECMTRLGILDRAAPDPRAPCGDLSEELWVASQDRLSAMLHGIRDLAGEHPITGVFGDTDCRAQSEEDYGNALQFAAAAPGWVAPEYIACAVHRELRGGSEAFPLWSALDAARGNGSVTALLGRLDSSAFQDERTRRRITELLDDGSGSQPRGTR